MSRRVCGFDPLEEIIRLGLSMLVIGRDYLARETADARFLRLETPFWHNAGIALRYTAPALGYTVAALRDTTPALHDTVPALDNTASEAKSAMPES